MRWLGVATSMVELSLCWIVGTLAGLVVLGWAPASTAVARATQQMIAEGASGHPVGEFVADYRSSWTRANRLSWPATLGTLLAVVDALALRRLDSPAARPLAVALVMVTLLGALAGGYVLASTIEPDDDRTPWQVWQAALSLTVASPATAAAWLVSVASITVVCLVVRPLLVLLAPAALVGVTAWACQRRIHQLGAQAGLDDSRTRNS